MEATIRPRRGAPDAAGGGGRLSGQDVVTRLIRLHNVPGEAAARVFRPLVAAFGNIESLASPNAIVVTDYAENVRRIERLAQALDGGGGASFDSIVLTHATARDVAAAIQGVMGEPSAAGGPRVAADERSNIVLVRGEPAMIAQARRIAMAGQARRCHPGDTHDPAEQQRRQIGDRGAARDHGRTRKGE